MTQVSITLTFDNLEALSEYLGANPAARDQKVASAQPSASVTPITDIPKVTSDQPAPAPAPAPAAPTPQPTTNPAPAVDTADLKSKLMGRLRSMAESMEDPSAIAALINSFGVARFSELPDDQLQAFETELNNQFGAAS